MQVRVRCHASWDRLNYSVLCWKSFLFSHFNIIPENKRATHWSTGKCLFLGLGLMVITKVACQGPTGRLRVRVSTKTQGSICVILATWMMSPINNNYIGAPSRFLMQTTEVHIPLILFHWSAGKLLLFSTNTRIIVNVLYESRKKKFL